MKDIIISITQKIARCSRPITGSYYMVANIILNGYNKVSQAPKVQDIDGRDLWAGLQAVGPRLAGPFEPLL